MPDARTQQFCIVLGDAVASRTTEDREAMERRLRSTCERVNTSFREDLRAPFRPIKGLDEFGGALRTPGRLHRIVAALVSGLAPVAYRLVAVRGEVDAGLDSSDISLMDGPAFHLAARIMERLKSGKLLFEAALGDGSTDALLTGYLNLLSFHLNELSDRQWEAIRAVELEGTQESAAKTLGVSQQAVSKMLVRARWQELETLQEKLDAALLEPAPVERGSRT